MGSDTNSMLNDGYFKNKDSLQFNSINSSENPFKKTLTTGFEKSTEAQTKD